MVKFFLNAYDFRPCFIKMVRYFIFVIENSLTQTLLLSFIAAAHYVHCIYIEEKTKRCFSMGIAAGTLGALAFAVMQRTTRINRGFVNTGLLSLSVVAGVFFVMLSWGFLHKRFPSIHKKIFSVSGFILTGSLLCYTLAPVFLNPTEFVMAGEAVFSTEVLFKFIGWAGGIFVLVFIAFVFFRIMQNLYRFSSAGNGAGEFDNLLKIILTLGLLIYGAQELTTIIQFLLARRIIPMNRFVFRIVIAASDHRSMFLYLSMLVSLAAPAVLFLRSLRSGGEFKNPAEHRKYRVFLRNSRRLSGAAAAGLVLSLVTLTGLKAWNEKAVVLSPAEPFSLSGDEIFLMIENVGDGHLHRFAYTTEDGTEVRFIVIRKNDVAFGVGLDACDICGSTGYYERKDQVICILCDVVMNKNTIGFKGGCNPVPLAYRIEDGSMVIRTADMENEKKRFK